MFLINVRISSIYLFFLAHMVRINVEAPLGPPISNSKIGGCHGLILILKYKSKLL
jgi:hypothetical protein